MPDDDRLFFWHRAMFAATVDTIRRDPSVAELMTEHLMIITHWVEHGAARQDRAAAESLALLYQHMIDAGVEPPRSKTTRWEQTQAGLGDGAITA